MVGTLRFAQSPAMAAIEFWYEFGSISALRWFFCEGRCSELPHQAVGTRSLARCLTLALFSWPQAAMMSRPRGERTGLA